MDLLIVLILFVDLVFLLEMFATLGVAADKGGAGYRPGPSTTINRPGHEVSAD